MKFAAILTILFSASVVFAGVSEDRKIMNHARAKYNAGQFSEAERLYSQIKPKSDYWLMAIEERAHTHGKAGNYNKALADLTTLISPLFEGSLGPEPYFTAALTYLKLCQYEHIYGILDKFKANMKIRATALSEIVKRKADAKVFAAATSAKKKGSAAYADKVIEFPTLFHLDAEVRVHLKRGNKQKLLSRIATLAAADLNEISVNTKKLHLVEAEVMQRLNKLEDTKGDNRTRLGKFKAGKDQLQFPFNDELWIDELNSYQVESERCPKDVEI